jgi:hypothetical protein
MAMSPPAAPTSSQSRAAVLSRWRSHKVTKSATDMAEAG